MRHCQRPAAGDLLAEDRNHAAGGAEDVAEAHGDEPRRNIGTVPVGLDDPLAQRLRLAHHRLRVRSLVGRDENEALRAELDRDLGDRPRAERVVAHRLERIRLHHRDVLVRRRVEDDTRAVLVEDLAHLDAVLHVADDRGGGVKPALVDELALDLEQRRLSVVDEDDPRRPDARDLPTELRADRATCARHEHGLTSEILRDRLEVDLDRLAAEHVLDLHRPQLCGEIDISSHELGKPRQRLHRETFGSRDLDNPLAQPAGSRRNRNQHLVWPAVVDQMLQVGDRPEDADAVEAKVALARVVVDEADRRVPELWVSQHLLDDALRRIAGADDERLLATRNDPAGPRPLDQRAS